MKLRPQHLFLLIIFFLNACKYSPTETNKHTIKTPENNISITILDTNSINILRGEVTIAVQTILNGHQVVDIEGYLDNTKLSLDRTRPGYVSFQSDYYQDGDYVLNLVLYTTTNSGSMADRTGQELFYSAQQCSVTVFNSPITAPIITNFTVVDGVLSVNWSQYSQPGFKSYVLKKNNTTIASITNYQQTSFRDTNYIGESAAYVLTTSMLSYSLTSSEKYCILSPATFVSAALIADDQVQLKWNRCVFTHAFEKYIITGLYDTLNIRSIEDTLCIDSLPPIGEIGAKYYLQVEGKDGLKSNAVAIQGPPLGDMLDPSDGQIKYYIPDRNVYLGFSGRAPDVVYEYDGESLNFIKQTKLFYSSYDGAKDITSDGAYIYMHDGATSGTIKKINTTTYSVEESYDYSTLIQHPSWKPYALRVSNGGKMAAIFIDDRSVMHLYVFDINSKTVLASLDFEYGYYTAALQFSSNGKYIMFVEGLYNYQSGVLTKIGSVVSGIFRGDSTIMRSTVNSIQYINCSDLQIYKEIPVQETLSPGQYYYDKHKDLIGIWASGGFVIYDASTAVKRANIRTTAGVRIIENGVYFSEWAYYKRIVLN